MNLLEQDILDYLNKKKTIVNVDELIKSLHKQKPYYFDHTSQEGINKMVTHALNRLISSGKVNVNIITLPDYSRLLVLEKANPSN